MAFTVDDYRDLIALLREHPDWKAELRREILDEQFLQLPALVRDNSSDIRELKLVVAQNSADIRQNSADIRQNSDDIRQNSDDIRKNSDDIRTNSDDIRKNSIDIQKLTAALAEFAHATDLRFTRVETKLGDLDGGQLESWYRSHPEALAIGRLRKVRVANISDLVDLTEAVEEGRISASQGRGLAELDLLIAGREGRAQESRDAWLAVEVSGTIDNHDVTRAAERAATLRTFGFNAYGAVAGRAVSPPVVKLAAELGVEVYERRSA